jgi:transposase
MNEVKSETQSIQYWVGIDWGESEHAVAVVDERRNVLQQFKLAASLEALQDLAVRLHALKSVAGIAIESTRNPILPFLLGEGFTIFPVNPKLSSHWREGNSVGGVKNDARDGLVLALELSRRHESLRTCTPNEAAAELSGLCESLRDLIDQRTALLQRLKATIRQYYPGAMEFFSDWSSPVAWRFLKKFPNPSKLSRAQKSTLIQFLKANRIGLKPLWLERIERRKTASQWPLPDDAAALELMALATVAQLQALQPHIEKLDRLIDERSKKSPQARLMKSLPGAGPRLAPALTAIAETVLHEKDRLQALRGLSGVAPVEKQSGKSRRIKIRRRCNKHWRNIMHLFARCSIASCRWAKAYYDLCRERGDRYASALRKLADKWLKIIDRMLDTGEAYDDKRYVNALKDNGSPVYKKLCEKNC